MAVGQQHDKATYPYTVVTEWRERLGLSQTKFGQLVGISRDHVSKLENGTREFTYRMQLACERVSIMIAVQRREIGLVLPNAFEDAAMLGIMVADAEKEDKK